MSVLLLLSKLLHFWKIRLSTVELFREAWDEWAEHKIWPGHLNTIGQFLWRRQKFLTGVRQSSIPSYPFLLSCPTKSALQSKKTSW